MQKVCHFPLTFASGHSKWVVVLRAWAFRPKDKDKTNSRPFLSSSKKIGPNSLSSFLGLLRLFTRATSKWSLNNGWQDFVELSNWRDPRPRINRLSTRVLACARNLCLFAAANKGFHRYIFDLKTTFLECCVPCLIVSNRDQLFKFLNQSISMTCTAFKRPTKKLGMHGLFIFGLGTRLTWGRLEREVESEKMHPID